MGRIPLILTNMVFRWSVWGIKKEPHDRYRHEVLSTIDTIDWTGKVQDGPLRTLEDARVWMGSTIVPIHFPVSSNIQFPVFYHFPLSSIFLSRDLPERSDFSSIFPVFLHWWKWKICRKNDGLNKSRKRKKKNRIKGAKNWKIWERRGRDMGTKDSSGHPFLASLKTIREVRDALFASTVNIPPIPYPIRVFGK